MCLWCVSPSEALYHRRGRDGAHAEQHDQQEQEAHGARQSPAPPVWRALPSQQRRSQPEVLALSQRVTLFQVGDGDLVALCVCCVLLAGVHASSLQHIFHELALLTSSGTSFQKQKLSTDRYIDSDTLMVMLELERYFLG